MGGLTIKILTLWEPWATFIAMGFKKWETRGWPTSYRGPLAIHAAKNVTAIKDGTPNRLLEETGLLAQRLAVPFPEDYVWPLGKIVAVCRVADCLATETAKPSSLEAALGNYLPGRFAWVLEDVKRVKPFAFTGMQGLKDLPRDVEARLEIAA